MEPTLHHGDFVLVDSSGDMSARVEVGDLVLAVHPDDAELLVVKRLADRLDDGRVVLSSDNPDGSDSRTWGPLPAGTVKGRVQLVLGRPLAATDLPGSGELFGWLRR